MTVKIQSMCFFFSNHRGPQVPGAYLLMFKSCESTVFFGPTQEKSSQNQEFFSPRDHNEVENHVSCDFPNLLGNFGK